MTESFSVACVQFCADDDLRTNLKFAEQLTRQASAARADLICLPEYFASIEVDDETTLTKSQTEQSHPALEMFTELAKELSVWIQAGSLPISVNKTQLNNRAFLINDTGAIVARYNKMHLFDVELAGGESYLESKVVRAGTDMTLTDLPWGKLGMTICYDVRFPALYRQMAILGADFITVPAAFTQTTGEAHWHSLLRARAIENGCYIFAAGQCGIRKTGRATYGHSLIIDPWGTILADAGPKDGIIVAKIDPKRVQEVRKMIPSLHHG